MRWRRNAGRRLRQICLQIGAVSCTVLAVGNNKPPLNPLRIGLPGIRGDVGSNPAGPSFSSPMFWLKKAVTFWLMPLNASLTLMILGAVLAFSPRWARAGRRIALAGLLLLLVASNRQVGLWLLGPLERTYPAIPEIPAGAPLPPALARCRYIVVLGGGHAEATALPATSRLSVYALGRITEAVRLARLLPDATIITSGPASAPGRTSHAAMLARAAISLGIAPDRFLCIDQARDTEDETYAVRERIGAAPFALVTSAWHMPRAMGLMRQAGLHPLACPADYHARAEDEFSWSDLQWGIDGLERTTWAVHERLGLLWGRLRGKI